LSVYDGNSVTSFTAEHGLTGDNVSSLLEDNAGRIWIGTAGNGVIVYDRDSLTRFDTSNGLISNQIKSLIEDSAGRAWIATNVGASVYDGRKFSHFTIEDGLVDNDLRTLLEDRKGCVWMGTAFGVSVYDGENFTTFTEKDGLVNNDVTCLLEDSSGRIWIGTYSTGVSVYDGESFSSITKDDGLVSNNVHSLLEDTSGQIWIGTAGGDVSRFDGKSFQSLTHEDGLPGGRIGALIEDTYGHIWIGAASGVVRYRSGHTPPRISLTDVVTNRRRGPIDRIRLPSTQSLLAFEYRSLSLKTRPGGMVYRYRLKGYDKQWQTTHDQRVEYRDLPRGNYAFELQAVDRDLSYSEVPVQVAVAVHLPYGRIAIWLVLAAALAMGHWQIVQMRRRGAKLRAARDELELRIRQRTSELTRSNVMLTKEMAERQKVEAALAESEERFRKFFENEPEYCYMISPQGIILEVNSAALSTLGYERKDLAGKPLKTIYAPECQQKMNRVFEIWRKTGEVRDQEMTIITRGGDRRTVLLSASRVLDGNGKALYSISVQRDVTEQRRLEQQQQKQQKKLAHVSRLTVAGELASGIAHELNQPLGAIATFSDGCKRLVESGQADSPEVRDGLMQISAQAKRGGEIIRRMRRFVRKHELDFSPADLNNIVREASGLAQIGEADGRIELSLELAEEPLTVLVDRIQIQQVVINLIQNGLDSMRETQGAGGCLRVRTARLGHDKVEVAVTDRGEGLADEDIERVFEPFLTTKPGGLGIGLSISRSIVEAHGGHVWARSNPDQGMTFGFELPSK
jgi:two-component system sensor kinase FixL